MIDIPLGEGEASITVRDVLADSVAPDPAVDSRSSASSPPWQPK